MTFPTILVAEGAHIYLLLISLPSFLCRSVLVTVCDLLLIRLPHLFSTERVFLLGNAFNITTSKAYTITI